MPKVSKTPKYKFGKAKGNLSNQQWMRSGMATYGSAILFNSAHENGVRL